LPYWVQVEGSEHLVVPYTLDTNDMRFSSPAGFPSGEQFFAHLRDAFDVLWREGSEGSPKMLSVGLHCRLAGRPARTAALEHFLDHVLSHERVWVARRIEIAEHWRKTFPAG
jgi:peptidoglycan/xylan/chitin deacetylase (PgdA/CDA1 family)